MIKPALAWIGSSAALGLAVFLLSQTIPLWNDHASMRSYIQISGASSSSSTSARMSVNAAEARRRARIAAQKNSSSARSVQWGAYVGGDPEDAAAFEKQTGLKLSNRATFVHWGNENEFPLDLKASMKGKTLTIFWEAMDYNRANDDQAEYSYDAILRGDFDNYIKQFAKDAKTYGEPVILIPFEEMNGNWYQWSGSAFGNTPQDHIAAYRYLRKFFRDATNVKFGWGVNSNSVPDTKENSISVYYPGDAYVDVVGVHGFNFDDPWMTFDQIFRKPLTELSKYNKPVHIFSMASADGPKKAAWITDAFTVQLPKYPAVKAWTWFNEDKEQDWRVWSDAASLKAFKKVVGQ